MFSLIVPPPYFLCSLRSVSSPSFPLLSPDFPARNPRGRRRRPLKAVCFALVSVKQRGRSLGITGLKRRGFGRTVCCLDKGWEVSEGEAALEGQILEFMTKSGKPEAFPSKKELMDAGRLDLVEEISRRGGWWALGWSSDDDDNGTEPVAIVCDVNNMEKRAESSQETNSFPSLGNSFQPALPSGRPLKPLDEDGTGIEGILDRLKKQRNLSFGINLETNGNGAQASSEMNTDESHSRLKMDVSRADLENPSRLSSDGFHKSTKEECPNSNLDHNGSASQLRDSSDSLDRGTWRAWSSQRAGVSYEEFQAAEISFTKNKMEIVNNVLVENSLGNPVDAEEILENVNHTDIKNRLQSLELVLTSVLQSLRRTSLKNAFEENNQNSPTDLLKLSDELEFKENDYKNDLDRLRSICAQMTVLEGKMTLAIIDLQKLSKEKQKRVDGARTAMQLLRSTCIVWPNSASEVLVTGSFDGWTTKRKMQKSSAGQWSVFLKLYPGRYEIKFIVDGVWKTDPLRPIVNNHGYENNLLIIS